MSRLKWGDLGERLFETGVDRGVLYLEDASGVAWSGLVSVTEEPVGGEAVPYYIDGIKYLNRALSEEFEATVEAYTYPDEFALYDGSQRIGNGLFATQQRRKSFGLSYRSLVGNDVEGADYAYKIHIIYNALASPSQHTNSSIGDSISPDNFSWKITTKAPLRAGRRPTAHFVIDSRETPAALLAEVEGILYGTETEAPRLPTLHELIYHFTADPSIFDAGEVLDPFYNEFDGGVVPEPQTSTIDGGTP